MKTKWTALVLVCASFALTVRGLIGQESGARVHQLYLEARSEEQHGRLDAAIQKYHEIVRLDPRLAPAYNNLGRLYFKEGRYPEAIKVFKRGLAISPNMAASRTLLGVCYYEIYDYKEASRELTKALHLSPNDSNTKLYLARSLLMLNDLDAAASLLKYLHRNSPKDIQILYDLGEVYMKLAASTLGEIQRVDHNSYLIDVLLGKTAEAKQAYAEAIEHFKQATSKAPDVPGLHYLLGHALYENGQFSDSLHAFHRELQLNPYNYMACWEAALILLNSNPQEALKLSSRALELNPDLPAAYMVRGRALLALKKPQAAIDDFTKAITLDPDEDTAHFQLARAYTQLGMIQKAQAEDAIFQRMEQAIHSPKKKDVVPRP